VKAEEIQVSQEELTSYLLERAAQSGVDPNQLAQQYVQSGNLPALMADVARGKALALVVEKANVVDASGNPVDLNRLQEDGTMAEPDAAQGSAATSVPTGFEFAELDESEAAQADDDQAESGEDAEAGAAMGSADEGSEAGEAEDADESASGDDARQQ
jgi:trigger factor